MLFAEALETVKCLDEGVIESVADANIGSILGIGFPGWTGGVLQYINGYDGGLAGFVARARELAEHVRRALRAARLAGREGRARRDLQRRAGAGRGLRAQRAAACADRARRPACSSSSPGFRVRSRASAPRSSGRAPRSPRALASSSPRGGPGRDEVRLHGHPAQVRGQDARAHLRRRRQRATSPSAIAVNAAATRCGSCPSACTQLELPPTRQPDPRSDSSDAAARTIAGASGTRPGRPFWFDGQPTSSCRAPPPIVQSSNFGKSPRVLTAQGRGSSGAACRWPGRSPRR